MTDDVDAYVKARDGAQMLVDAFTELIELRNPHPEATWDPGKIVWIDSTGTRGPYQKATPQNSPDYQAMRTNLENNGGRLTKDGFFYWLFQDSTTIGRKQRVQPPP